MRSPQVGLTSGRQTSDRHDTSDWRNEINRVPWRSHGISSRVLFLAIRSPLTAIRSPLTAIRSPLTAIRSLLTMIRCLPTTIRSLLTAIHGLLTSFCAPLTASRRPPTAIRGLLATSHARAASYLGYFLLNRSFQSCMAKTGSIFGVTTRGFAPYCSMRTKGPQKTFGNRYCCTVSAKIRKVAG